VFSSTHPREPALVACAAIAAVGVAFAALVVWFAWSAKYPVDLTVYRLGGHLWLDGGDLYRSLAATAGGIRLPFTYPPFAAITVVPLALVPLAAAAALMVLLSLGTLAATLRVSLRGGTDRASGRPSMRLVAILLPLMLLLEPVWSTIGYGQVNLVLMALVALDCLVDTPWWPRGLLVGLAAAIKLTPAVFLLYFLVRGDRRAALVGAATFCAATAVSVLLAWNDSVNYWSSVVFKTERIGGREAASNQSVFGVLTRFGLDGAGRTALWLFLGAGILALAVIGMRRSFGSARPGLALVINAAAGLLLSPVSWSHHWVWFVVAVVVLGREWRGSSSARWLTIIGVGVFVIAPDRWLPAGRGPTGSWSIGQQMFGNLYVWYALAGLVLAVVVLPATALRTPTGRLSPGEAAAARSRA
jgi:alpha-1,2-mannosyltransferase